MQATFSHSRSSSPWFVYCFLIFALCATLALSLPAIVDFATSHGPAKHGYSALEVRTCLNKSGALQIWVNPTTGRRANVCQLDPETFGIQITEKSGDVWKEITAFTKAKMTRIEQVMQYLTNSGYVIH